MFNSKKGFQISINMIVVLILGIVILGFGFAIFSSGFKSVVELKQNVDSQTAQRINSLLDDGSILVVPFANKDAKRGDSADFSLGINNELGSSHRFSVLVTYGGSTAFNTSKDPFNPVNFRDFSPSQSSITDVTVVCHGQDSSPEKCGTSWVLKFDPENVYVKKDFVIKNNDKFLIPITIVIPKDNVKKGQYIFNLDVCYNKTSSSADCVVNGGIITNRYGTRQKLYVKI